MSSTITTNVISVYLETFIKVNFNGRSVNILIFCMLQYNQQTLNDNGELVRPICAQNELRINNTLFPHNKQHQRTWVNINLS